jgi:hypothetical protein
MFQDVGLNMKRLDITAAPTGAEQDTGWDLPAKSLVLAVWLDVTAAEVTGTTKTINVGLLSSESGGDADGFLAGAAADATGLVKGTLDSAGQTLGTFLHVDEDGAGVLVPELHVTGDAVSVSYKADDTDWVEFRGSIYLLYIQL